MRDFNTSNMVHLAPGQSLRERECFVKALGAGDSVAGAGSLLQSAAMLGRLYQVVIAEPLAWIDALQAQPSPGPRSPQFKAVTAGLLAAVMLTLMNFVVLDGEFQMRWSQRVLDLVNVMPDGGLRDLLIDVSPLYRHVAWSLGCVTFYFVIPALVVVFVFREPLTNFGISPRGFLKHLPIYLGLFVPVFVAVLVASRTEAFQHTYPFYHYPLGLWDLGVWEFCYCLQFFALEFFFRGFMVHAMKHRIGSMAVVAMVVPYCMIHFQKPMAEAFGAIVAGTVLGVLSLRTGTLWGGVFIHSAVAITMDWASLVQRGALPF